MLMGALALASMPSAAGQPAVRANGYDSGWYISDFWSGEHPNGFSVTRTDTVVLARRSMDKAAPRDVACRLPYLAVIHPWNRRRIAASRIKFLSATKIVGLIAKEPFVFEHTSSHANRKLQIKKGDVIEYLRNDAEGSFEVRIAGEQYTAGQDLLDHAHDVADDQFVENDWVSLTCTSGRRAWIFSRSLGWAATIRKGRRRAFPQSVRDRQDMEARAI